MHTDIGTLFFAIPIVIRGIDSAMVAARKKAAQRFGRKSAERRDEILSGRQASSETELYILRAASCGVDFPKSAEDVAAGPGDGGVVSRELTADDRRTASREKASRSSDEKEKKALHSRREGAQWRTVEPPWKRPFAESTLRGEDSTTRRDDVVAKTGDCVETQWFDGLEAPCRLYGLDDYVSVTRVIENPFFSPTGVVRDNAVVATYRQGNDFCSLATDDETAAVAKIDRGTTARTCDNVVRGNIVSYGRSYFDDGAAALMMIGYHVETGDYAVRVVVYAHGRAPDGTAVSRERNGLCLTTFGNQREVSFDDEIGDRTFGTSVDVARDDDRSRPTEVRAGPEGVGDADALQCGVDRPKRKRVGFFGRWKRRIASAFCCGRPPLDDA